MFKRKYGDRPDWTRIVKRDYAQTFLHTQEFQGHITLIKVVKVTEPLFVMYGHKRVCIVDDGYLWLQHFPFGKHYSMTTMFDACGDIVQWYIDICYENGVENQIPWMDDLYLDIVVLPSGESYLLDEDELEEAYHEGSIDFALFDLARQEAFRLQQLIKADKFELLSLAKKHKKLLLEENEG
ncbi:putative RNA-binding protein associated with RNAse of E/G family [Pullulanibacillus pueri]|uniref:DUF402 domain-containing protein n=1 Tax=Pullulanibacillus pueri TaxID=1437324 RepID=A0A8J2ZWF9_9BACL|nr:DUF402 domain-containing protein [Pullulanibacillus pueri]MBM7680932.1 putative RNA-binding protein associated with RNAse of E/G family [Pullulanibacillus pueri]GGH81386.1 hypothetical protein GCM10007096_19210 [Pullulanibacillus pueri]